MSQIYEHKHKCVCAQTEPTTKKHRKRHQRREKPLPPVDRRTCTGESGSSSSSVWQRLSLSKRVKCRADERLSCTKILSEGNHWWSLHTHSPVDMLRICRMVAIEANGASRWPRASVEWDNSPLKGCSCLQVVKLKHPEILKRQTTAELQRAASCGHSSAAAGLMR